MNVTPIESGSKPISGGAMDRVVERKGLSKQLKVGIGFVLLVLGAGTFYVMAPTPGSQTVAADRVTVSTVRRGTFDDFLPLRARVTPLVSVYLDAVEGGRVEQVLVEDGAIVSKGQLLAVLSNSDLQLNLLARQADVSRELNSMRSQELALAQTRLANERALIEAQLAAEKAGRQYEIQRPLAEKGFVSGKAFGDARDEYEAARRRYEVLRRTRLTDERLQTSQLAQLRDSNASLASSLNIARATLEALNIRAPVSGQLTAFSIDVGQSISRGGRLGQIDTEGNKLTAEVDEFYLGRVKPGLTATTEWGGKAFNLKVDKVYPQVRNGTFAIDLLFVSRAPADVQRGQTLQTRLILGDSAPALLLPNGAYYTETGGAFVFVVASDGDEARKRRVRLGRRNAQFVEVLEGLEPGERVITSPYTGFADKDRLDLETK